LNENPSGMPTSDRVQVRKDQHGDQHQGIGWDADSVDLGHVEALGSIAVLDGFLSERREERELISVYSRRGFGMVRNSPRTE
jgi:hypothetical protein